MVMGTNCIIIMNLWALRLQVYMAMGTSSNEQNLNGQMGMVILSKIGVTYPCCQMWNMCFSRSGVDNLILLIMNFLMTQGGSQEEDLTSRLVCLGANGVSTFQGLISKVTIQIQWQYVPFTPNSIIIGVHCKVHQINLTIQTLSHLPLVSCVATFL